MGMFYAVRREMKHLLLTSALIALLTISSATKFSDCGSTTGQVNAVTVTDCPDNVEVCPLPKGSHPAITINFTSKAASNSLKAVVQGIVFNVPIEFNIPKSNACQTSVTCPVKNGENYMYNASFTVLNSYPTIPVLVVYELKDEKGNNMACVEIECQITKK